MAKKTPAELGQELLEHLGKGEWVANEAEVNRLVNAGADLTQRDADGNTALLLTALHGLPKIGVAFVNDPKKRSDINAVNNRGDSALLMSVQPPSALAERADEDYLPIADALLLRPDLDVNAHGPKKPSESPLTVVAGRGYFKYVQAIANKGGDLDFEDWQHENALAKAKKAQFGDASVKVLEEAYQQRENQRETERKAEQLAQLQQMVVEVTGIVGRGAGTDMTAPEKASFAKRPRKYDIPV